MSVDHDFSSYDKFKENTRFLYVQFNVETNRVTTFLMITEKSMFVQINKTNTLI